MEFLFKIFVSKQEIIWKALNLENTVRDQPYILIVLIGFCKEKEDASLSVEDNNPM